MLPPEFQWLSTQTDSPQMILEAVKLYGVLEGPGPAINPIIISWAKETKLYEAGYVNDDIPWCGLFMAVVAKRANKKLPPTPLRALSWKSFGVSTRKPSLGDVLVFKRTGGGHVALYVGEDTQSYYCLGGNQGDAVTIVAKAKERLYACRRPLYRVQPDSVVPVIVTPTLAFGSSNISEV